MVTIDMSTVYPAHKRCFAAIGSGASMELRDSYSGKVAVRRGPPGEHGVPEELVPIPKDMPLLLEIRAFLEHIRGGPPPMTSGADDLAIVERVADIETMAKEAGRRRDALVQDDPQSVTVSRNR